VNFIKDSIEEMRKVTWPTRNQAIKLTIITMIFTALATAFILLFDTGFRAGYDFLIEISPKAQQATIPTDEAATGETPVTDSTSMPLSDFSTEGIEAVDSEGNPVDINVNPVE
jgi:preprotein translocase SecE subunit